MSTKAENAMYIKTRLNAKKDPYIYRLPVLPESIKISFNANNSSAQIVDIGEITQKMGRKAKVISFESFFPMGEFKGSVPWKDSHYPITFINAIEKSIDRKLTVRFTFSRAGKNELALSLLCTIEKFEYHEDGEDPNTIHYSITLKEYRSPAINQIVKKKSGSSGKGKAGKKKSSNRAKTSTKPKTYTIKKGDTLWAIAKKFLGSGNKWKSIYNANKSVIEKAAKKHGKSSSSTGHWIYPGTVINIPK